MYLQIHKVSFVIYHDRQLIQHAQLFSPPGCSKCNRRWAWNDDEDECLSFLCRRQAVQVRGLRTSVLPGTGSSQARGGAPRRPALHLLRVRPALSSARRAATALCTEPCGHQDILVHRLRQVIQLLAGRTPPPPQPPWSGLVEEQRLSNLSVSPHKCVMWWCKYKRAAETRQAHLSYSTQVYYTWCILI